MIPNANYSYYLIFGIWKLDNWRFFTQIMYYKIDTMGDKVDFLVTKMKAHEAQLHQEDDSMVPGSFSKLQTKCDRWKQSRKSWKSLDSNSKSKSSNSEDQTKHHCIHWRDAQECKRYHKIGHIGGYCPSTALVESKAPTETASLMTTTLIEN